MKDAYAEAGKAYNKGGGGKPRAQALSALGDALTLAHAHLTGQTTDENQPAKGISAASDVLHDASEHPENYVGMEPHLAALTSAREMMENPGATAPQPAPAPAGVGVHAEYAEKLTPAIAAATTTKGASTLEHAQRAHQAIAQAHAALSAGDTAAAKFYGATADLHLKQTSGSDAEKAAPMLGAVSVSRAKDGLRDLKKHVGGSFVGGKLPTGEAAPQQAPAPAYALPAPVGHARFGLPTDVPASQDYATRFKAHVLAVHAAKEGSAAHFTATQALRDAVDAHVKKTRETTTHTPIQASTEDAHVIHFHGTRLSYHPSLHSEAVNFLAGQLTNPSPAPLVSANRTVALTPQAHNGTDAVIKASGMKTSAASYIAGVSDTKRNTVIFGKREVNRGTYDHESAHAYAIAHWGTHRPPASSAFGKAIAHKDEAPVSAYGMTSSIEDFPEAVRMYTAKPAFMKENYPRRYEAIRQMIEEGKR